MTFIVSRMSNAKLLYQMLTIFRIKFPAKIFPTRYRSTCHGFSAAIGKLGLIIVLLVLKFAVNPEYSISIPLGIFSIVMAIGAGLAWILLPDVAVRSYKSSEGL